MFRHGFYSFDKRPVGGWSSGQYTPCCRYCHCIVLTARKHDVYTISHPRKPWLRGGAALATFKAACPHARISRGGRRRWRLPAGAIRKRSTRGIFVSIVLVNASRERPIVTCCVLDGSGRLTSIFYQCRVTLRHFFFSPQDNNRAAFGNYKRNIAYDVIN